MAMKQQSALEFIVAYSWALLIISLFIVIVFVLADSRPPSVYLQSSCSIQPLFPCTESLLTYKSSSSNPLQYYILFTNQLGSVIYFPPNAMNVSENIANGGNANSYSLGNCNPSFASQDSSVFCSANIIGLKPKVGSQLIVDFVLSYNICSSGTRSSCAPGLYKSSGYSVQDVAPSTINLNNLTLFTSPSGTIVVSGVTYFNSISTFLPTGNYVIYAQPSYGKHFLSWTISSPNSLITNTVSQNTTLELLSNAVVTARFG